MIALIPTVFYLTQLLVDLVAVKFADIIGYRTYVTYLNRCKVRCAAMLLKNGKSVTEACFEAGFGSLSGFRYAFRQRMGLSPKDYMQR